MQKEWYKSKGMIGGLLVVVGGVLTAVGQLFTGQLDISSFFTQVVPMIGVGLGIVGVRAKLG